jgi:hypothetical protein
MAYTTTADSGWVAFFRADWEVTQSTNARPGLGTKGIPVGQWYAGTK